jgi:hypothetical protein
VECHPHRDNKIVATLTDRFAPTHNVQRIDRTLDVDGLPKWMDGSSGLDRLLALWKWRSTPTPWLWMTAKPATQ